jgi:serine protease DegS
VLELDSEFGIELVHVYPSSPAAQAGLRRGDIITHINDQPIQVSRQALNIVAALMPGDVIELRGIRSGRGFSIDARAGEQPPPGN